MKTLTFIYQENEIHFLVNPNDKNVMVNATEMAKMFGKKTRLFLKTDHAKSFIAELKRTPYGVQINDKRHPNGGQIIDDRGRNGIYFNRKLALKFATWLDVKFELWVFDTIDEIIFGNYKKHWDAHAEQEAARAAMEQIKTELLANPNLENAAGYFQAESQYKSARYMKTAAIRAQLKLFGN
jgi:hypothetical protein